MVGLELWAGWDGREGLVSIDLTFSAVFESFSEIAQLLQPRPRPHQIRLRAKS